MRIQERNTIRGIAFLLLVIFTLVAISFMGCSHQKYISKHKDEICGNICPSKEIITTVDSIVIKNDTVYKTITVTVPLPGDTIVVTKYIHVNNGMAEMDTVYATNGLAHAMAYIVGNELKLMVYNDPSYLAVVTAMHVNENKEIYHKETSGKTITVTETVTRWWLVITALLIGIFGKTILMFIWKKIKI